MLNDGRECFLVIFSPMAWFLFIDESGHDRSKSPYEVLAGVAIQDHAVREVITRLHAAEIRSEVPSKGVEIRKGGE